MPRKWSIAAGTPCRFCFKPIESARKNDACCRSCDAKRAREYRALPRVRVRKVEMFREKRYGLSAAEYDAMLAAQGGVCAICGRPERATRGGAQKSLSVDHNHVTGSRRGLLCQSCNTAIGLLDDSPGLLRSAVKYLRSWR